MSSTKNVISLFKRDILVFAATFINSILLARFLGPELVGQWSIALLIIMLAETFLRPKTDLASVMIFSDESKHKHQIILYANSLSIFFSFIGSFLIFIALSVLQSDALTVRGLSVHPAYYFPCYILPLHYLNLNYCYFQIMTRKFNIYNYMVITGSVLGTAALFLLLFTTKYGLGSAMIAFTLSTVSSLMIGIINTHKYPLSLPTFFDPVLFKKLLARSYQVYVSNILSSVQLNSLQLLASILLPLRDVAYLYQGLTLSKLLAKIMSPINTVILPSLGNKDLSMDFFLLRFRISTIVLVTASIFISLIAYPMITLFYGVQFVQTAFVLILLMPGTTLYFLLSLLLSLSNSRGSGVLIARAQLPYTLLMILLIYLGIKILGLYSAVFLFSLGISIIYYTTLTLLASRFGFSIVDCLPTQNDLLFLLQALRTALTH